MSSDPYVLLGLSRTRQRWFSDLSRWSASGAAPIEFVKCLTAEEARAVLGSGRRLSALVADGGTPGLDRDLIATAATLGVPTLVVDDGRVRRDWDSLGCVVRLEPGFDPDELTAVLVRHARAVPRISHVASRVAIEPEPTRSRLVAVTGAGGTGASTVAMCLAQALGGEPRAGHVALADGSRVSDLALYHDVGDVIPGLPELVEAHRVDHPDPALVRDLCFAIDHRGYDLLLGMRTSRDWVAMRHHSLRAALAGMERAYDLVVLDHDPDVEGEAETGSLGVEDRHAIARAAIERCDLVLAVGNPGIKGTHDLARLTHSLRGAGVPPPRILPVVNRAPRGMPARAALTRTLHDLAAGERPGRASLGPSPLYLRTLRGVEAAHRSASRLPDALCRPLGRAVQQLLLELGHRAREQADPVPVRPGELGTHAVPGWFDPTGRPTSDVA